MKIIPGKSVTSSKAPKTGLSVVMKQQKDQNGCGGGREQDGSER